MKDREIHAAGSFSHPLFVAALLTLAFNDHVLKASGALPALSGKLSDFAGLLVAPLVLAWLLRVRSRRAFAASHVAVGVGFTLIQLPAIAGALNTLSVHLGLPIHIWADPSDLLALPALALSFSVLGRRQARARPILGLIALVFCTATNAPGQGDTPPRYPFPPAGRLEADVFIRNHLSADLHIRLRQVRDEVTLECDEMLRSPRAAFTDGSFGEEREWNVAARDGVPLWDRRGGGMTRECYAVLLLARDHEWLITWRHGTPALAEIAIRLEPHESPEANAMRVSNQPQSPPSVPTGVGVHVWEE